MTSSSELSTMDDKNPTKDGSEVYRLRKVTSLSALRGRTSLPRAFDDGPASVASKFSRAASLGRFKSTRQQAAPTKERLKMFRSASMDSKRSRYHRASATLHTATNQESKAWAVGRLSMMFLLMVTFTDTAFRVVNNQLSQIESHDYYDALSPDVIRPAFTYKSPQVLTIEKPSLGLGSAAISSITDALGPILPFTGGVDLRRSEYYAGNILENLYGLMKQTYQAYADASEDSKKDTTIANNDVKRKQAQKKGNKKHVLTLGASDPFVSLDKVADLTLQEVGTLFDYATKRNIEGFNHKKFQNGVLPRVRSVIQAMENAVSKSRGSTMEVSKFTAKDTTPGNMDAFFFCAVMRVFAEWRILRQVPEGYKGYAVGMSLGQKDVVQNVAKMERAAQTWIDHQLEYDAHVVSPTLRDVLQYEIDIEEHPSLPRLKEASGGMGLLWVRRQLHYQTVIFQNILEVPSRFPASKEAVAAAYTEVYGQYHGWAVQKVFSYSFQASPRVEEIFKFMNPHKLAEVEEIARKSRTKPFVEIETNANQKEKSQTDPPENIFHRIGWEWDKLVDGMRDNLSKLGPKDKKVSRGLSGEGFQGAELEEFICAEMGKNVHEHIVSYLSVVKPLLGDLAHLFKGLNMDDPTKV